VPSRKHKQILALPQAPQQFKQMLMGPASPFFSRPCFRDEVAGATGRRAILQLDFEMSLPAGGRVNVAETSCSSFESFSDKRVSPVPFLRNTYAESMLKYVPTSRLRKPARHPRPTDFFAGVDFPSLKGNPCAASWPTAPAARASSSSLAQIRHLHRRRVTGT
jgi:aspartyl-tRNA synthetase